MLKPHVMQPAGHRLPAQNRIRVSAGLLSGAGAAAFAAGVMGRSGGDADYPEAELVLREREAQEQEQQLQTLQLTQLTLRLALTLSENLVLIRPPEQSGSNPMEQNAARHTLDAALPALEQKDRETAAEIRQVLSLIGSPSRLTPERRTRLSLLRQRLETRMDRTRETLLELIRQRTDRPAGIMGPRLLPTTAVEQTEAGRETTVFRQTERRTEHETTRQLRELTEHKQQFLALLEAADGEEQDRVWQTAVEQTELVLRYGKEAGTEPSPETAEVIRQLELRRQTGAEPGTPEQGRGAAPVLPGEAPARQETDRQRQTAAEPDTPEQGHGAAPVPSGEAPAGQKADRQRQTAAIQTEPTTQTGTVTGKEQPSGAADTVQNTERITQNETKIHLIALKAMVQAAGSREYVQLLQALAGQLPMRPEQTALQEQEAEQLALATAAMPAVQILARSLEAGRLKRQELNDEINHLPDPVRQSLLTLAEESELFYKKESKTVQTRTREERLEEILRTGRRKNLQELVEETTRLIREKEHSRTALEEEAAAGLELRRLITGTRQERHRRILELLDRMEPEERAVLAGAAAQTAPETVPPEQAAGETRRSVPERILIHLLEQAEDPAAVVQQLRRSSPVLALQELRQMEHTVAEQLTVYIRSKGRDRTEETRKLLSSLDEREKLVLLRRLERSGLVKYTGEQSEHETLTVQERLERDLTFRTQKEYKSFRYRLNEYLKTVELPPTEAAVELEQWAEGEKLREERILRPVIRTLTRTRPEAWNRSLIGQTAELPAEELILRAVTRREGPEYEQLLRQIRSHPSPEGILESRIRKLVMGLPAATEQTPAAETPPELTLLRRTELLSEPEQPFPQTGAGIPGRTELRQQTIRLRREPLARRLNQAAEARTNQVLLRRRIMEETGVLPVQPHLPEKLEQQTTLELLMKPTPVFLRKLDHREKKTEQARTARWNLPRALRVRARRPVLSALEPEQTVAETTELPAPPLELRRDRQARTIREAAERSAAQSVALAVEHQEPRLKQLQSRDREQMQTLERQEEDIRSLRAQLEEQETLVRRSLEKTLNPAEQPAVQIKSIARAVMKEMEGQLRLERQRRGMS